MRTINCQKNVQELQTEIDTYTKKNCLNAPIYVGLFFFFVNFEKEALHCDVLFPALT
jgi:hypothetical protein